MDARFDNPTSQLAPASATERSVLESNEMRAILSNLSHELCRPLVSLRSGFDLLLGDSASPVTTDQRRHLQTMIDLCENLLGLTRSYLDYAGLAQGSRSLHYGTFTLGALTRDVDRENAPKAASNGLEWSCGLEGPDATVLIDASRCQQIVGNLVANALKYTPPGGRVRVLIRFDGPAWFLTVEDSGFGIPAEDQARVFEPFYRLPREVRSRIEGNGLGLSICRELVEQMGGEIDLESEPGRGTRVSVRFPVEQPRSRPHESAPMASRPR